MTLFASIEIQRHSVTITAVSTTDDGLGNTSATSAPRTATGVLYAPEGLAESTGATSPAVIGDATLYGNTGPCDSDDTVLHEVTCCDGSHFPLGLWQVVGGSKGWGGTNYALPIQRASSA